MKRFAVVAFLVGIVGTVGFAGAAKPDPDPTGTWKWTSKFGKGDKAKEVENTLKLTYKDGKLTGTVSGGFGGKDTESKIEDGKYEKGELSFTVTREVKDNKFTTKYTGKVADDTIKGTITSNFGDKEFKQDWEAKRVKDEKKEETKKN